MNVKLLLEGKSLSKIEYMQVLEIIGLGNIASSSRQIEKQWIGNRQTTNSYIYEIIKKLHKPETAGQIDAERFLKVSYKETAIEKIRNIEATQKDVYVRELKIALITNNPRNWRYRLNLKGFLLYLRLVGENDKADTRKINSIINNLTNYEEFDFLGYFDVFGNADKVKLLVQIATELNSNLITYSREYLKYYIMKRCYEEISIWLDIQDNFFIKKFSRFMKKRDIEDSDKLTAELRNFKINIINELIPIHENMLVDLKIDLKKTKQSNLF
jgi:hypothetical protein